MTKNIVKDISEEGKYPLHIIGSFDLVYEDGGISAKYDDWDNENEAINILFSKMFMVSVSIADAKELQNELNKIFK